MIEKIIIGSGVAEGINLHAFDSMPKAIKNKIIKIMSRISEQSYRRGYQHGKLPSSIADAVDFRFRTNKDRSPYTDVVTKTGIWAKQSGHTAKERLLMENHILMELGF